MVHRSALKRSYSLDRCEQVERSKRQRTIKNLAKITASLETAILGLKKKDKVQLKNPKRRHPQERGQQKN